MPIHTGRRVKPGIPLCLGPVLLLALVASGCVRQQASTGPFPGFAEFQGEQIRDVRMVGELSVPRDSLLAVVRTRPTRCRAFFLPFCIPFTDIGREEHRLDLNELAQDVVRIQLYHRDHGYYGARVEPDVLSVAEGVEVEFFVDAGRQVMLQQLAIEGTDTLLDADAIRRAIPIEEGAPFGRADFLASADSIRQRLLRRGFVYADVLRNYSIDTIAGVAEAEFQVLPGPLVLVDTIVIEGYERLSEGTLRDQLTFREGQPLRTDALSASQRNLYSLNMVNLAAIRLDAAEATEAETQLATVRVQVVEAAEYAVDTSVGFGTVECFRTAGRWTDRNFLGGARRLELNGSLSRVGIASPTDLGLDRICTPIGEGGFLDLAGLEVLDKVDYLMSANLRQPRLLGTENQISLNLHNERTSEPDAYIRESAGGRLSVIRELDILQVILTSSIDIERGLTVARPALLCVGFDTCSQNDLEQLQRYRWSNSVSTAAFLDRTPLVGSGESGFLLRGGVDWASGLLGSDDKYLRTLTEAAYFYPLRPGYTLAVNVEFGRFLRGALGSADGYIPPERRFYAGGPSSVRGYTRNALGPTTYITRVEAPGDTLGSPTGGTQLVVSSVELRMPSPFLSDVVSLAAFVDAGNVTAPGAAVFDRSGVRFTPGAGLRFQTPVGPFRFDLAYNPYRGEPGPLYRSSNDTGLILTRTEYQPPAASLLGRFRVQFALGQAF